jgi:hypothetical protein
MKKLLTGAIQTLLIAATVWAQPTSGPRELLDRLAGTWVMEGLIGGNEIVHDVEAHWVLGHYMQLHEVAREKDANGEPAYEAIVLFAFEAESGEYTCMWLDTTGETGLSGTAGRAKPQGDEIRLLFTGDTESVIHTTFAYDRSTDTWQLRIDTGPPDRQRAFARVTLRRG